MTLKTSANKTWTLCTHHYDDDLLIPIRPRIRELQEEIDEIEWEGLAPEKLSDKLNELQYLQERESLGELYIPEF